MSVASRDLWQRRLLGFQGIYYLAAGLWPIVSMSSFERVTGAKVDDWLVRMVGLLAAVIGATLVIAVRRLRSQPVETIVLAVGSALAFTLIDMWYGLTGRIAAVYLADAALELTLVAGLWLSSRLDGSHK